MRDGAGLIIPVHANLRQFLESLPAREVDAVVLLDSQDWMAPDEISALWNAIDRTGSDDVRVIFRTAGAESPWKARSLRRCGKSGAATRNAARSASNGPIGNLRRVPLLRQALTGEGAAE